MSLASPQFGKLREVGEKLRQNMKTADDMLERANECFSKLDLQVEVLDKKSFCEIRQPDGNGRVLESIYDLCYGRADNGTWGLCTRHYLHSSQAGAQDGDTNPAEETPQLELAQIQLLDTHSAELRQKALMRLPAFVEVLIADFDRRNQELEKANSLIEAALKQLGSNFSNVVPQPSAANVKSQEQEKLTTKKKTTHNDQNRA